MCVLNRICICFSHLLHCVVLSKNCQIHANVKFDLCANVIKVKQICFTLFVHQVNPFSLEQMCVLTHIYRLFFACKCRGNMRFDLCANMTKVKQTWYFTTFAHHVNPFSSEQMCGVTHFYRLFFACKCRANMIFDFCVNMTKVKPTWSFNTFAHHANPFSLEQMYRVTHIYRRGKVVLNVYFLLHICNGVWILRKCGIYHVCFACKCLAKTLFDLCANMAKVEQTHCFGGLFYRIFATHVNLFSWSKSACYLHIYCKSKVVSNVYIFLTFAVVCKYSRKCFKRKSRSNMKFGFWANMTKFDQIWYLLHICYRFATFANPFFWCSVKPVITKI